MTRRRKSSWLASVAVWVAAAATHGCAARGSAPVPPAPSPCAPGSVRAGGSCLLAARDLSAGPWHTCAVLTSGAVACWGHVGGRSYPGSSSPKLVPGIAGAVRVQAGFERACATKTDGTAACWRAAVGGPDGVSPASWAGRARVVRVGGGRRYVLDESGTLTTQPTARTDKPGSAPQVISDVRQVSFALFRWCALTGDGGVLCNQAPGDDGATPESSDEALPVPAPPAMHVDAGYAAPCIAFRDGSVRCRVWGGVLREIPDIRDTAGLAVASTTGCAILADRTVGCWGMDWRDGQFLPRTSVAPGLVRDVVQLVAGAFHFCARTAAGVVICWPQHEGGNKYGQLGNGTTSPVNDPVVVAFPD